ncbi:small membrane protein [uncultured Cedecea sp.]
MENLLFIILTTVLFIAAVFLIISYIRDTKSTKLPVSKRKR